MSQQTQRQSPQRGKARAWNILTVRSCVPQFAHPLMSTVSSTANAKGLSVKASYHRTNLYIKLYSYGNVRARHGTHGTDRRSADCRARSPYFSYPFTFWQLLRHFSRDDSCKSQASGTSDPEQYMPCRTMRLCDPCGLLLYEAKGACLETRDCFRRYVQQQ